MTVWTAPNPESTTRSMLSRMLHTTFSGGSAPGSPAIASLTSFSSSATRLNQSFPPACSSVFSLAAHFGAIDSVGSVYDFAGA